jgi:hypothetical protein
MAKTTQHRQQVEFIRPDGFSLAGAAQPKSRGGLRNKTERPNVTISADYLRTLPLTERDRQIVRYLSEVGYATTAQLYHLFFHDLAHPEKEAQRRLLKLWSWHVLDRMPGTGLEKYGIWSQLVYSPGKAGLLMLDEEDPEGGKWRKRRGTALMSHNVLLSGYLVDLAATADRIGWTYSFHGERTASVEFQQDGRWLRMRPDGLLFLGSSSPCAERILFLELDTSMSEVDNCAQKIIQYERYFLSGVWKLQYRQFPTVLFILWAASPGGLGPEANEQRRRRADARLWQVGNFVTSWRRQGAKEVEFVLARWDVAGSGKVSTANGYGPGSLQSTDIFSTGPFYSS